MKATLFFADEKVKNAFNKLKTSSKSCDRELLTLLENAFDALSENAFCGVQVPKGLIPKTYRKRNGALKNLWKYNLNRSLRLLYTVASDGDTIVVIIEWLDHTSYDRRFGYS